jgi:hypothetical protein
MKPYDCPFCNHSFKQAALFKHFGRCALATIMVDERIAAQAEAFRQMTDEEMEVQIGIAMNHLVNLFVQENGREPPAVWLAEKEVLIRQNAAQFRKYK